MSGNGLTLAIKLAIKLAILHANYIATRLGQHFPVLYRGRDGFVAHECSLARATFSRGDPSGRRAVLYRPSFMLS